MKIYEVTGTTPATPTVTDQVAASIKQLRLTNQSKNKLLADALQELLNQPPPDARTLTLVDYVSRATQKISARNTPGAIAPSATAMDTTPRGPNRLKRAFAKGHRRGEKVARAVSTKRQSKQGYF